MAKEFQVEDLVQVPAVEITEVKKAETPRVEIFKYRDKWAVKVGTDNYIFPTLGQTLNEARAILTGKEEE